MTPISNPAAHLLCWSITTSNQATFTVDELTSWHGATDHRPARLAVPAHVEEPHWSAGPKPASATGTRSLHLLPGELCVADTTISAHSQEGHPHRPVREHFATVGAPTQLCIPTQKTVNSQVTPITDPTDHLLCFAITVRRPGVHETPFDQNQFGTGLVKLTNAKTLCLPSETP